MDNLGNPGVNVPIMSSSMKGETSRLHHGKHISPGGIICGLLIFLFSLAAISEETHSGTGKATLSDRKLEESRKLLTDAGISPDPADLVEFVKNGSPSDVNRQFFQENGLPLTQAIISSIQLLSLEKPDGAFPLFIQTARGEFTPGQNAFVEQDAMSIARSLQEKKKESLHLFLKYNAINALGLMGNSEALPALQEIFQETDVDLIKIKAALSMASLGYGGGIEYLVHMVDNKDRTLAVEATQALSLVTGKDLDYTLFTPVSRRKRTIDEVEEWWKKNGEFFRPDGVEIRARRLARRAAPSPSPGSVRGLILIASLPQFAAGTSESGEEWTVIDARERLAALGTGILPELRPLCLDREEDLNIRMEALRRFTRLATWEESRDVLKQAKKDKNPEIKELAKNLLKDLKRKDN